MLVIPDLVRHSLVVNEKHCAAHASELKRFGGREGRVELPAAPSAAFASTLRREATGAIVLGGPRVLVKQGLIRDVRPLRGADQGHGR